PETVDHPLEIGVERLRHHLRRPTHRRTEMTQSTRVTPLSGQTHRRYSMPPAASANMHSTERTTLPLTAMTERGSQRGTEMGWDVPHLLRSRRSASIN
ncbi:hypothetical protein, partial [Nocardia terrae]|uniref:hypothetical protein n=1 Tax=Nocardia terrae TaxID=2675851 RepID=UPI001A9ABBB4